MKRFLGIMFLCLFLCGNSLAGVSTGYKKGTGPLKVTEHTANVIEYFFSGGKNGVYAKKQKEAWKPGLMAISVDGAFYSFIRHPLRVTQVDNQHYAGMAVGDCKKKSGQECYLFANGYRIVWDNGTNRKKRRLKRKDIRSGKTITLLTELGFFDNKTSSSNSTQKEVEKKETKTKKETEADKDIVKKLKELKELLDSGALSKEEFEKAKKKLLN
ncbi:SHOCT domain-containing protein [Candidatus Pelagibacter sp.]|nr:SHOCT domain-containing protein [Candidatus Pelagibacter sp.]